MAFGEPSAQGSLLASTSDFVKYALLEQVYPPFASTQQVEDEDVCAWEDVVRLNSTLVEANISNLVDWLGVALEAKALQAVTKRALNRFNLLLDRPVTALGDDYNSTIIQELLRVLQSEQKQQELDVHTSIYQQQSKQITIGEDRIVRENQQFGSLGLLQQAPSLRPVRLLCESTQTILDTDDQIAKYQSPRQHQGKSLSPKASQHSRAKMAQTPLLGQFLVAINGFVAARNEAQFTDYLVLEPPFSPHYQNMINELRQAYSKGREDALEQRCEQSLPSAIEGEEGSSWSALVRFMSCYLSYLRDVDADQSKLLRTYDLLSELQEKANNALKNGPLGYVILPTTIRVAKLVCRLAIGLDKRPELIAHLRGTNPSTAGGDESGERETLPERAAKIVQGAFNTCVSDRNTTVGGQKDGTPGGKKAGIVALANLCLRILFQCRKTRNANYLFSQIGESAPPLSAYPKSQRVTYLYYLGRYYFQNNHFFRAQAALQQAYNEAPSHDECAKQRRLILLYLVASNIILGRFPSQALLSQPEAIRFEDHFLPLCIAIRKGDLSLFRRHLDPKTSPHVDWFIKHRIWLQLRNRCEVLVWRSLVRKVFLLAGRQPDPSTRLAPTVDVDDLVTVFKALLLYHGIADNPIDPDLDGASIENDEILLPDEYSLESVLSSLIDQGLLGGYVSHTQRKFAITGAKQKGVLAAGFPQPWTVIKASADHGSIPGWKQDGNTGVGGAPSGGGRVIHLSGARPAGS